MIPGNAFATQRSAAMARIANGASWFVWIAGTSLVNAVIALTGSQWRFFLGLGLTEVIDSIPTTAAGHAIAFVCDLLVAGTWILFNLQAKQGKKWPFILGIVFYALDAILVLIGQEWIGVAFHGYAIYRMFQGLKSVSELGQIDMAERHQAAMANGQYGYAAAPAGVWPPPPVASQPSWPVPANAPQAPAWPPTAQNPQAPPWNAPPAQAPAWNPPPGEAPAWNPAPAEAPAWTPPAEGQQQGVYPPNNR